MKKIIVLGAGLIQVPVIIQAKKSNIYIIALDYDENAPGIIYADEFYAISTNDFEKVLSLAKDHQIDGILTTSDYPVNVVAKVAKELGLIGMPIQVAKLCTDKYLQRQFLLDEGINVPRFMKINSLQELSTVDFFPCVIKPTDSSASRGVKRVNNKSELSKQYPISSKLSKSASVVVEEFIPGREFSVETLTQKGITHIIQITEKLVLGEKNGYFVEDTHIAPARISLDEKSAIESTVFNVLKKMSIDNCPTHTELKINDKGVFIVEIACRLGGDFITSDLVPLSTGVNMLQNLISLSLGEEINIEKSVNSVSAIQFLNNNNYEKCVDFINKGYEFMKKSEVLPYNSQEIKSSNDRLGYIILNTPDMSLMEKLLTKLN